MPATYSSSASASAYQRNRRFGYWWAPVMLVALVLLVVAYLHPYQPLTLSDLPAKVVASSATLDQSFGAPVTNTFKYAIRRSYTSATGPQDVEIRVSLRPMGNGLIMRQDDWYDIEGHSMVYQERYILFRNLFTVHTRSRDVAPLVHDLMGRIGWYNDSADSVNSTLQGTTPDSPDWKLDLTMDRTSDTDGKSLTLQTTHYQRRQHCERNGNIDGSAIGAGFSGSYSKVTCRSTTGDPSAERQSDYAWLPAYGIFLLLGYQQQADISNQGAPKMEAKGRYISFEAKP